MESKGCVRGRPHIFSKSLITRVKVIIDIWLIQPTFMRYCLWVIKNEQWINELLTNNMKNFSNFCLFLLTSWDFAVTDWCGGNLFTRNQTCWHLSVKKKKTHYLSSKKNIGMTFTDISSCQQVRFLTNCEPLKYCVLWIEWEILLLQVFFFFSLNPYTCLY